jgi:Ca2+-binding RTX toxin-like protein
MATITGGDGNDTLYGSTGRDLMQGLFGDDVLVSSLGVDVMEGGLGADRFVFRNKSEAEHHDEILDFKWWEGDKIDVSAIDAKEGFSWSTWGNQAFTFKGYIGDGVLGRGELGYLQGYLSSGDNPGYKTIIYGNTDSDSDYELRFLVDGRKDFWASDFVL